MTPHDLTQYLHDHIPLSAAMAAEVTALSPDAVSVTAPLAPNINHRDTAFGGSVSATAILAAWALVHHRLTADPTTPPHKLVIAENHIAYTTPIDTTFTATARLADPAAYPRFHKTLLRHRKARIAVTATVNCNGQTGATFTGTFVALQ